MTHLQLVKSMPSAGVAAQSRGTLSKPKSRLCKRTAVLLTTEGEKQFNRKGLMLDFGFGSALK